MTRVMNSRRRLARAQTPYSRTRVKFGSRLKNAAQTFLDGPAKLEQRITDKFIDLGGRIDKRFDQVKSYVHEIEDLPRKGAEWVSALAAAGVTAKAGAAGFANFLAKSKVGQMAISEEQVLANALSPYMSYETIYNTFYNIPFAGEGQPLFVGEGSAMFHVLKGASRWTAKRERQLQRYLTEGWEEMPEALPTLADYLGSSAGLGGAGALEGVSTEALIALAGLPIGI